MFILTTLCLFLTQSYLNVHSPKNTSFGIQFKLLGFYKLIVYLTKLSVTYEDMKYGNLSYKVIYKIGRHIIQCVTF